MIHVWTLLRGQAPALFDAGITRLLGDTGGAGWEVPLFDYFKRSCEYGIFIRGACPWSIQFHI